MTNVGWIFLALPVFLLLGAWGMLKLFSALNSEDGERYRKMRMQGPFVPLDTEDIAEDELRQKRSP